MADTVESQGSRWRRPSRRTTWVLGGVLAVALSAAVTVAWHWWTHPHLLRDREGDAVAVIPRHRAEDPVAVAITSARDHGSPVAWTWQGARADFATNTAGATAEFSVCDTGPQFVAPEGVVLDPDVGLAQGCTAVHPLVDGTRLTYPDPHQVLVVILRPTRAGRVHLTGVDVRYALGVEHLFRHGTDHVTVDVRFGVH